MAWSFGDSFDLYAAPADAINGYWDSGSVAAGSGLVAGRFSGSRAVSMGTADRYIKSSGANDAAHHFIVSFQQYSTITGSALPTFLQLLDGATAQCSIVFRSDGAILLTSGGPTGTALATYTGAFPVAGTWYAFEIEVVINNTTGSFTVRKNGNTSADFTAASLNTRGGTANNFANRMTLGWNAGGNTQYVDDLFWRSDASSVAWLGDIRCFTRMPASDASVQFSRAPASVTQTPFTAATFQSPNATISFYSPVTASYDGTVSTLSVPLNAGFTGNLKCSVFNDASGVPGTVRSSATTITNPVTGSNAFAFGTPFTVARGTQYWIGLAGDGSYANAFNGTASGSSGRYSTATGYSAFPAASPTTVVNNAILFTWTITLSLNCQVVSEPQQDAATSYVYDSTAGHADFYGVGAIASTPVASFAVVTRGYMEKSDAGTRTAAVQLKSGGTTVASPTLVLTTSGWQWAWRMDLTDPNTGAAWTPAGVNNCTIGPTVVS